MMKIFIPIVFLFPLLSGCISSSVKGFTDPEYTSFKPNKILVYMSDDFGEAFKNNLTQLTNVQVFKSSDLFLPTRSYTEEDIRSLLVKEIKSNNIDAMLTIEMTGDESSKQVTSYQTYSDANAYNYGNTVKVSGTSTTIPVTTESRNSSAKIQLVKLGVKEGTGIVWVGTINTSAKGGFYTGSNSTMNSMAKETVKELIRKGHLSWKN